MTERAVQLRLGVAAILAAAFLIFYAIPTWVSAPSNVAKIILSPLFWPYVLSGCLALTGAGLFAAGLKMPQDGTTLDAPSVERGAAYVRLFVMALFMALTMYLLPRLGMVLTSMLLLAATAFLVRTRHPVAALVCAVLIPLVLYAFFAHVAGVAIPQGHYVRLP